FGTVAGGWQMAKAALIAKQRLDDGAQDFDFYRAKIASARFYAEHVVPHAMAYKAAVVNGAASTLALEEAQF
ncbi:MAG: acyl-CoA dehydrogenase C-terminal domain-containing protein, partial [Burkholderiales bacterium]